MAPMPLSFTLNRLPGAITIDLNVRSEWMDISDVLFFFLACLSTETDSRTKNSNFQPSSPNKLSQKRIFYMDVREIFLWNKVGSSEQA